MKILIENLTFETILGILEVERLNPQKVQIDCTIDYPYSHGNFINYADVATYIETTMQDEKFELIETALETVTHSLKTLFPLIAELTLTIRKPNILTNCTVGVEYRTLF